MTRVALVTAAAAGLPKGIATDLARHGYELAFTVRPGGTAAGATVAAVRATGRDPLVIPADFADVAAAASAVAATEKHFGRLDVVVHAVGPIVVRRFERCTLDDYRAMIEPNLTSAVAIAFAALPGMRTRRFGRLVYFGMNGSHATLPARGMTLYGAAKAGVVTFARALAIEEARHNITVNVVEPGDIRDKSIDRTAARAVAANNPTGHAGSWEDIAAAVRFAVADDASFLNGMVLGVNGGLAEAHE
ncbi:MAG: SDR family oxidoreductase [Vulcanimicrobiaceae bacterium]